MGLLTEIVNKPNSPPQKASIVATIDQDFHACTEPAGPRRFLKGFLKGPEFLKGLRTRQPKDPSKHLQNAFKNPLKTFQEGPPGLPVQKGPRPLDSLCLGELSFPLKLQEQSPNIRSFREGILGPQSSQCWSSLRVCFYLRRLT